MSRAIHKGLGLEQHRLVMLDGARTHECTVLHFRAVDAPALCQTVDDREPDVVSCSIVLASGVA